MRQKLIVGNWKMYTDTTEAERLARAVAEGVGMEHRVCVAVCPPFPYLALVASNLQGSSVELGAQNLYPEKEGAFTGEVSPTMLLDLGCKFVILGHSERRQKLGESNRFINQKVHVALDAGLNVILCVGETLEQREANQTAEVLEQQIIRCLAALSADSLPRLSIAYEPIWAIGNTGRHATPQQADEEHVVIRKSLAQMFGKPAQSVVIQYGGSVKPENAAALLSQPNVDGALIGGAILKTDQFLAIVQVAIEQTQTERNSVKSNAATPSSTPNAGPTIMTEIPLYPLRFEPDYQYRLWGGRRLEHVLSAPLPDGPVGEAWVLSDRDDHPSRVADGPLKGKTVGELLKRAPEEFLGPLAGHYNRFPLLLKFLDVSKGLSVQVHPSDAHKELIPAGDTGKTEAWVVLEKGPDARIYAGLKPGTTSDVLRKAIEKGAVSDQLASFSPSLGDGVFIRAGTVHSLRDVVVFEVQENSDVTFRLYDWDHIDPKTGQGRPLQVDQAMSCINFDQGTIGPVVPQLHKAKPLPWENLINCDHFGVWRASEEFDFVVGAAGTCRVLVGLEGRGDLQHLDVDYPFGEGDVLLLPAVVGACRCRPNGNVTVLEISLPEIR